MEGNPVSESTIDPTPPITVFGAGETKVFAAVVGGVHVAGATQDHRGWVVTSTLAREVPQLVAKDEEDARAFLLFLAQLYTGEFGRAAAAVSA